MFIKKKRKARCDGFCAPLCSFYDHILLKFCESQHYSSNKFTVWCVIQFSHIENIHRNTSGEEIINDLYSLRRAACDSIKFCYY